MRAISCRTPFCRCTRNYRSSPTTRVRVFAVGCARRRESVTEPSSQKSLLMLADPDLERLVAPNNGDPVEESDYRNMIVTRAGELMRTEFNGQA